MQKRETERQMETRMRSHAHLRELREAEPWVDMRMHNRAQGANLLVQSCRQVYMKNSNNIDMSMKQVAYVELVSPSTWISSSNKCAPRLVHTIPPVLLIQISIISYFGYFDPEKITLDNENLLLSG